MSEATYKARVLSILEPQFEIYEEIPGVHFSGEPMRLDAIVQPKACSDWKRLSVALGIEFKNGDRNMSDMRDYTSWLAQCVDYAHTDWMGFGYIYIFTCPGITDGQHIKNTGDTTTWTLARVMGHLGIGELRFDEMYGLTFSLQGQHRIWSQAKGVEEGSRWTLQRKFGSR